MSNDPRPLYEQVKHVLRTEIAEGRYVPGEPFVSQQKVCDRFGVSAITAIRALNDLAAEGLLVRRPGRGTFVAEPGRSDDGPANSARRVQGSATRVGAGEAPTIACITPGFQSLHTAQVITGVEAVCAELGYHLTLTNSVDAAEREERALLRALESGANGVVLYPAQGAIHRDVFEKLRQAGIPIVMIDRYRPDVATDAVTIDDLSLGRQLTEYLIERGHRQILTVWSETGCTSVWDRLSGHIQALRDHQLPVRSALTVLRDYNSMPPAQRTAMLAEILEGPDSPSAVLCANGYVLALVAQDLITLGVDVPDEIELAGLDDAGPYSLLSLAVVAAMLPSEELGRQATRLLARRMASEDPYRDLEHLVLPVRIRTRDSAVGYLRTARTDDS